MKHLRSIILIFTIAFSSSMIMSQSGHSSGDTLPQDSVKDNMSQGASDNEIALKLYNRAEKNFEDGYYESVMEDTLNVIRKSSDPQLKKNAFALHDQANERIKKNYSDIRNWSGPRIGAVGIVDEKSRNALAEAKATFPVLSAFGWQFEYRFISGRPDEQVAGLIVFVPMILGIDQSVPMLSINGLIGLRFSSEFEVGVGPHMLLTPVDPYFHVGIALTVGQNFKTSKLNFPLNLGVVLGREIVRVGLFFGFNTVNQ